jgi:hypothetical protein
MGLRIAILFNYCLVAALGTGCAWPGPRTGASGFLAGCARNGLSPRGRIAGRI